MDTKTIAVIPQNLPPDSAQLRVLNGGCGCGCDETSSRGSAQAQPATEESCGCGCGCLTQRR